MKRVLSLKSIVLTLSFITINNNVYAQDRHSKDIPKLVKNVSRTEAFQFASFGWKDIPYEFVSLKDIDASKLSDTETNLLNTFTDVAICFKGSKVHCCYWVKDKDGNLGLIKFDGSVLVPPVKGNILQGTHPNRIVIGEQTINPNRWLDEYHSRLTTFSGRGLGHFAAVVDDVNDEKRIHATIPAGKYDDIMLGIKGSHTYYFVAKLIDGEMRWGVVDKNDKEVMAIEAKGIYKKKGAASWLYGNVGGKWVASETMDMSQIENMVYNDEVMAQQRREQLAETLTELGNSLKKTAAEIAQTQHRDEDEGDYIAISKDTGTSSASRSSSSSATGNKYNISEQQSYNSDKQTWGNYDSMLSAHFYGGRLATKNEVKQWQQKMKEIRTKWKAKGKSFPDSSNEKKSTSNCVSTSHSH